MSENQRMVSKKKWLVVGGLVVIVVGGWWWFSKSSSNASSTTVQGKRGVGMFSASEVPVKVAVVKQGVFDDYANALGTAIAYNSVNIVSRVQGELVKVLFTEGQQVKEGELLAVIDPRTYEAAVQQAKGSVQQNSALLQNARSELVRYQKLIKQDSIAKQTYDAQVALVNQYQGALTSSQAQLKDAELNLAFTQIKAPIAGRLGIRQIDIGNYIKVADTTPLVTITQTQPISATFTLPETQLPEVAGYLAEGKALLVEAWDSKADNLLTTGVLETLDNQINTSTGTILAKARFDNKDNILFPNQFINIKVKLKTLDNVLIIPTDAVQYGNKGTFVYLVDNNNKVHIRYLKLGSSDADKTVVLEGLAGGEKIVVEGTDRLREDTKVSITNAEEISSGSQAIKQTTTSDIVPVDGK